MQFDPATLKKILLNGLHSKILISELGVDLAFLKQLYVTGPVMFLGGADHLKWLNLVFFFASANRVFDVLFAGKCRKT